MSSIYDNQDYNQKHILDEIAKLDDEHYRISLKKSRLKECLYQYYEEKASKNEDIQDIQDIQDLSFIDFLNMKMSKRNGEVKDIIDDDKDDFEKTDFSYDISNIPSKSKTYNGKSKKNKEDIIDKDKNDKNDILNIEEKFIPISKLKNQKKFIIKGLVQSGKTEYMICLMLYMLLNKKSVVVVVRNIDDDRVQFCKRFEEFKKKYEKYFEDLKYICLIDNVLKYNNYQDKSPKIFLILDNQSNIRKMNIIFFSTDMRYVTIFDEADFVDSGKGMKAKQYDLLKLRSSKIFWVSATIMDMLAKEEGISGENIIFLNPSDKSNYKGIINNRIKIEKIPDSKYVGGVSDNIFECNPYFETFLIDYKKKEVFQNHPRICLVNLSHCIEPLERAQLKIGIDHPELSVIVYNSPGLIFQKGLKRIRGQEVKCNNVSTFLQYLKNNGGVDENSHIIILSGYMAGRGISFVSEDYGWHLTDEYLVMSKTADEPELIQKVRLQGIYRDDIPLTLYTTEDVKEDLIKSSIRMEELSKACKDNKVLTDIPISKEKFTKRDMTKNVTIKMNKISKNIGWSLDIYNGDELIPQEYLQIHGLEISEIDRKKFKEEKDNEELEDDVEKEKYNEEDGLRVYREHISKTAKKKINCFEYIIKYISDNNQYNKWILASTFYGEYDYRDVFHLYDVGEKNDENDKKGKGKYINMKKIGNQNRVWVKYNGLFC